MKYIQTAIVVLGLIHRILIIVDNIHEHKNSQRSNERVRPRRNRGPRF